MARESHAKEDWIAEATGMPFRAQLSVDGFEQPVVWGYRAPTCDATLGVGAASFVIGDDPVYHWNSDLELRRAYFDGRLIKAEGARLVAWRKERRDGQVQMFRHAFDDSEQDNFLTTLRTSLDKFEIGLYRGTAQVLRAAIPEGAAVDMLMQAKKWLAALPQRLPVADVPNVA